MRVEERGALGPWPNGRTLNRGREVRGEFGFEGKIELILGILVDSPHRDIK